MIQMNKKHENIADTIKSSIYGTAKKDEVRKSENIYNNQDTITCKTLIRNAQHYTSLDFSVDVIRFLNAFFILILNKKHVLMVLLYIFPFYKTRTNNSINNYIQLKETGFFYV